MKRQDLEDFIIDNGLLSTIPAFAAGIYAITIDDCIVYIGESISLMRRCSDHIYNIENAMLTQEKKYLLLLAAKLGGHNIDCQLLETCNPAERLEREKLFITSVKPILNINIPGEKRQDLDNLRIEDVLYSRCYHLDLGWVNSICSQKTEDCEKAV